MPSRTRAVICLVGIFGVISFADVASAGPRRWYNGSNGWRHWQRRSVRLGANPGWAGYNGRWAGYGGRHAYVRANRRGYNMPGYGSGQQYGLAMSGSGLGGYGATYGSRAGYGMSGSGQGYSGGSAGTYNAGPTNASGGSYGSGASRSSGTPTDSSIGQPYGSPPSPGNGNSIQQVAPDGNSTGTRSLDYGRSLSRAMDYRPATYCSFCYGGASSSPAQRIEPDAPSRQIPSDPMQRLFALDTRR